jgi:hypothetical protein
VWDDESRWVMVDNQDTANFSMLTGDSQDRRPNALYLDDNGMMYHRGAYVAAAITDPNLFSAPSVPFPLSGTIIGGGGNAAGTYTWKDIRTGGVSAWQGFAQASGTAPSTFLILHRVAICQRGEEARFTNATYVNNWKDYSSLPDHRIQFERGSFYKDDLGRVFLRGLIAKTSGTSDIAGSVEVSFTLPVGYRPLKRCLFVAYAGSTTGYCRVDVQPNGDVIVESGSQQWNSLSGINFLAEQ